MKYEILHGEKVPKIGFGTWRIGGEGSADPALESASKTALRSALELGYTHFDTAEYYAGGHAEDREPPGGAAAEVVEVARSGAQRRRDREIDVALEAPVAQPGTAVSAVSATPTTGADVAVDGCRMLFRW